MDAHNGSHESELSNSMWHEYPLKLRSCVHGCGCVAVWIVGRTAGEYMISYPDDTDAVFLQPVHCVLG